jgi:hypothetical protein
MSNVAFRRYSLQQTQSLGPATISGTIKKLTVNYAGQPVFLFFQEGFRLMRETRSAADGSYSFPLVRADTDWIVASIDAAGAYNIVAADRVRTP